MAYAIFDTPAIHEIPGIKELAQAGREMVPPLVIARPFLPVSNGRCGRWRDPRQAIDGILHRERTEVQWRDPPERFGPWKTVYERHRLWSGDGTWESSTCAFATAIGSALCGAKDGIDLCQDLVQLTGPQGNTIVGVPRHLLAKP